MTLEELKEAELGRTFEVWNLKSCCRTVYGGIAWPGKRPGFVVMLGIVRSDEPDGWEIYLLDEYESFNMRELIKQCGILNTKYEPDMWVGDTTNDSAEEFMYEMRGDFNCYLRETNLIEMEPFYPYVLGKLKELLNPKHRRLFLKNSKLLNCMGEIEPDQAAELERGDYPALEALIYATVELIRMVEDQSINFFPKYTGDVPPSPDEDLLRPGAIDRDWDDDDFDEESWYHTV